MKKRHAATHAEDYFQDNMNKTAYSEKKLVSVTFAILSFQGTTFPAYFCYACLSCHHIPLKKRLNFRVSKMILYAPAL